MARRSGRVPTGVLVVLVVLLSACSIVLALTQPDPAPAGGPRPPRSVDGTYQPADFADPAGAALAAAVAAVPRIGGYDYRHLADAGRQARSVTTPALAKQVVRRLVARAAQVRRDREVATVTVRGAGVTAVEQSDRVGCLLFADQVVRRGRSAPVVTTRLLDVVMVRRDGAWRVAAVGVA